MRSTALFALLLLGTSASSRAAEPDGARDAARNTRCADDPASAQLTVESAFSELLGVYRTRVPGPSGQRVLDVKVDALLGRTLDLDRFTATALSPMWGELDPERRRVWGEDLRVGLRGHYLKRLTGASAPLDNRLDITKSEVTCDRATIRATLASRRERDTTELVLQLQWSGTGWRAFDVSVNGVSLLETWKNRFRQIYRDGGIAAIDQQLRELADRAP